MAVVPCLGGIEAQGGLERDAIEDLLDHLQRSLDELLSGRAEGSERIARFQHFGPYDRLKAIYVQRFGLKRKWQAEP